VDIETPASFATSLIEIASYFLFKLKFSVFTYTQVLKTILYKTILYFIFI
jgi:hypothetical protein